MCEGINWRNLENWKEAFDILEERDYNKIVVKYLQERTVVEILGKDFYEDVHKNASVICKADLQGKHIGLIGETSYDLLVNFCAILYTGSVAVVDLRNRSGKDMFTGRSQRKINCYRQDGYFRRFIDGRGAEER